MKKNCFFCILMTAHDETEKTPRREAWKAEVSKAVRMFIQPEREEE